MSAERELLELAAKAAGVVSDGLGAYYDMERYAKWNPLADDGEALRLAVRLRANISVQHGFVVVTFLHGPNIVRGMQWTEGFGDDLYAATRRAITRAAAEIGRSMP